MNCSTSITQIRPAIHLHALSLADRDWISRIVRTENSKSADFNFGNLFLWDNTYCQKVAQFGDRLIIEYRKDDTLFFACRQIVVCDHGSFGHNHFICHILHDDRSAAGIGDGNVMRHSDSGIHVILFQ